MEPFPASQIFTFLFVTLGPFKIIGPFANLTRGADAQFARRLALRAILISTAALLLAAFVGESEVQKFRIPLPVLALAGGLILFLVALQTILQQFNPPLANEGEAPPPSMSMAIAPLAFPTIVTPYGIAALIIFEALSPDTRSKLAVGVILLVIMLLNLVAMLTARHIFRFMGIFLQILGSVLSVIQVALGLQIILVSLKAVWGMAALAP